MFLDPVNQYVFHASDLPAGSELGHLSLPRTEQRMPQTWFGKFIRNLLAISEAELLRSAAIGPGNTVWVSRAVHLWAHRSWNIYRITEVDGDLQEHGVQSPTNVGCSYIQQDKPIQLLLKVLHQWRVLPRQLFRCQTVLTIGISS